MAQPECKNLGTFNFKPTRFRSDAINSIGHTVHQSLPNRMLIRIIPGHQKHHTIRFGRFVFLSVKMNVLSELFTPQPLMINNMKTIKVKT